MIKIKNVNKINIKKGQIKLAHLPNSQICWVAKNLVNEVRVFNLNSPWPSKIVKKFAKSRSYLY